VSSTRPAPDLSRRRAGRAFPRLGSAWAPTPATTLPWFAVAHTVRSVEDDGRSIDVPASLVHAKRMGAVVTACGLSTMSWPRLFGVRFPVPRTEVCAACSEIVTPRRGR
jgi:hypothetical protein